MAPRRSGRRNVSPYKKGEFIEYNYKGSTVTGKLFKKVGTEAKPVWIVTPTDRRRRNEEIPERALGKVISAEEAMNNRGPKLKKSNKSPSPTSSDGSVDNQPPAAGRASPTEDDSMSNKKRKSDDSNGGSDRANKNRKTVTFSQESSATAPSKKKFKKPTNKKAIKVASTRIGTRSSRGSGAEMVLLPELPVKRNFKVKKVKKDENVTVVKMLTGTLYLYRGDRPRAEFVRTR